MNSNIRYAEMIAGCDVLPVTDLRHVYDYLKAQTRECELGSSRYLNIYLQNDDLIQITAEEDSYQMYFWLNGKQIHPNKTKRRSC